MLRLPDLRFQKGHASNHGPLRERESGSDYLLPTGEAQEGHLVRADLAPSSMC